MPHRPMQGIPENARASGFVPGGACVQDRVERVLAARAPAGPRQMPVIDVRREADWTGAAALPPIRPLAACRSEIMSHFGYPA